MWGRARHTCPAAQPFASAGLCCRISFDWPGAGVTAGPPRLPALHAPPLPSPCVCLSCLSAQRMRLLHRGRPIPLLRPGLPSELIAHARPSHPVAPMPAGAQRRLALRAARRPRPSHPHLARLALSHPTCVAAHALSPPNLPRFVPDSSPPLAPSRKQGAHASSISLAGRQPRPCLSPEIRTPRQLDHSTPPVPCRSAFPVCSSLRRTWI